MLFLLKNYGNILSNFQELFSISLQYQILLEYLSHKLSSDFKEHRNPLSNLAFRFIFPSSESVSHSVVSNSL